MTITYQSPGVYIQEVPAGPQPIAAVSPSILAVVGTTSRGPVREPTRITGWTDFVNVFGGPVANGHTAEAVYGYFENGGPAAYVVRVDPSTLGSWRVLERDGVTESFLVEARSPGAWSSSLSVVVAPDYSAGSGSLYASPVKVGAAPVNLVAGANQVEVESVAGLSPGDTVLFVTQAGTREATVDVIDAALNRLNVTAAAGAAFPLPAGGAWVTTVVDTAATNVRLATGSGIRAGDVVLFIPGSRATRSASVNAAVPAQPGLALTLGAGLGADVAGVEFGRRVERFTGDVAAALATGNLPLGTIVWRDTPGPRVADMAAGLQAVASNGVVGTWSTANSRLEFPANVPAGPVEVEARVALHRYTETNLNLVGQTRANLRDRYSFVPIGSTLHLVNAAGSLDLVRSAVADGFDAPAAPADEPETKTWTSLEVIPPADSTKGLLLRSAVAPVVDEWLDLGASGQQRIASVEEKGTGVYVVKTVAAANASGIASPYPLLGFQQTEVTPLRFSISASDGVLSETYTQLALDAGHPSYYFRDDQVNDKSKLIRVTQRALGPVTLADLPVAARKLATGADKAASALDLKNGFPLLETVTEPAIVVCPDVVEYDDMSQADVIGAMVTHCEEFRRFAIVDPPRSLRDKPLADWRQKTVSSIQAAVYGPYVKIINLDPASPQRVVEVPPSGFVAGVFARTDRERGVHKAPANERVRGIVGLAVEYTQRQQDLLNPAGVNLIRTFLGRGTRIWGARNATDDVQWRYVNVRRLFNVIETSVERGTQWVVFEPNIASTWLRIRVSVENFCEGLWRAGALAGNAPEQAYRVRVGLGETMTEADVDLGLVITEVAVAPAKPAEFVVFRFSHKRPSE